MLPDQVCILGMLSEFSVWKFTHLEKLQNFENKYRACELSYELNDWVLNHFAYTNSEFYAI